MQSQRFLYPPTFKRTKIIATVGPATNSYQMIHDMISSGANGLRLNFSHGTHEEREQQIKWIRQASQELDKPVAIYQDLQGPKIRLGDLHDDKMNVHVGDILHLVHNAEHHGHTIPIQYDISYKVKPGDRVYIFDGKVRTIATEVNEGAVSVQVENDGTLMSRKGVNLPDTNFSGDVLTLKDYEDLDFGVSHDIDYIGLSFVHSPDDIMILRNYLAEKNCQARVIAKIETSAAIQPDCLERIIEVSDAVMVARGDLAVEVGAEIVPVVQRDIIKLCQKHSKVSIVATQMMSSMVANPEPTRAEVSDISNSVVAEVDCVMLSDETANGKYPIESVKSMKRVILYTEEKVETEPLGRPIRSDNHSQAISAAAAMLVKQVDVDAIIAETKTGATAFQIAAQRPKCPIISVSSVPHVAQQLALLYANKTFLRPDSSSAGMSLARELSEWGYIKAGATVVVVSGRQPGVQGMTDTIRLRTL